MVTRPFLSDASANRIKNDLRARGFAQRLQVADPPRFIAFDRDGVVVAAQDVVVVWANLQPQGDSVDTVDVVSTSGELQRWQTLDVQVGDLFTLDDQTGEITQPVRVVNGVARAGFKLTGGA
ncbi:MAG: hypothetical protein ACR2OE_09480 [Thermomicrobiales bacterium]